MTYLSEAGARRGVHGLTPHERGRSGTRAWPVRLRGDPNHS